MGWSPSGLVRPRSGSRSGLARTSIYIFNIFLCIHMNIFVCIYMYIIFVFQLVYTCAVFIATLLPDRLCLHIEARISSCTMPHLL